MTRLARPALPALALVTVALAGGGRGAAPEILNVNPARDVKEVKLAVSPGGEITVAWIEDTRAPGEEFGSSVFVKAGRPGAWRTLGGNLNYIRLRDASNLDLALDEAGRPLLKWNENFGHADISVFRGWRGSAWTNWDVRRLGQDLTYAPRTVSLAGRGGEPVLAWGVQRKYQAGTQLYVQTWNGRTWVRGAPLNDGSKIVLSPSLALTKSGRPVVAWLEGQAITSDVLVKAWSGRSWIFLGGPLNLRPNTYTFQPVLKLDSADRPVVAWLEDRGGLDTLFVKRWTGARWEQLGDALNVNSALPAERPSLAVGADGRVFVVWSEGLEPNRRVRAKVWAKSRWTLLPVGSAPGRDADFANVAVDARGRATLAWREVRGRAHVALVRTSP